LRERYLDFHHSAGVKRKNHQFRTSEYILQLTVKLLRYLLRLVHRTLSDHLSKQKGGKAKQEHGHIGGGMSESRAGLGSFEIVVNNQSTMQRKRAHELGAAEDVGDEPDPGVVAVAEGVVEPEGRSEGVDTPMTDVPSVLPDVRGAVGGTLIVDNGGGEKWLGGPTTGTEAVVMLVRLPTLTEGKTAEMGMVESAVVPELSPPAVVMGGVGTIDGTPNTDHLKTSAGIKESGNARTRGHLCVRSRNECSSKGEGGAHGGRGSKQRGLARRALAEVNGLLI
jgi:hypothetical protein